MRRRLLGGLGLSTAALLLAALPVAAGGWATISPDTANPPQPNAGQPVDLGFTVLQHGQTAAGWVTATVVLQDAGTGEEVRSPARAEGVNGHFISTVTYPRAGFWSWRVELAELQVESPPITSTVMTAAGGPPPFDPVTMLTAIDQAKVTLRTEMEDRYEGRLERLDAQARSQQIELGSVRNQLTTASRERAALDARVASAEGGGVPLVGLLTIAGLIGGVAGFGLTVLSGRTRVASELSDDVSHPTAAAGAVPTTR